MASKLRGTWRRELVEIFRRTLGIAEGDGAMCKRKGGGVPAPHSVSGFRAFQSCPVEPECLLSADTIRELQEVDEHGRVFSIFFSVNLCAWCCYPQGDLSRAICFHLLSAAVQTAGLFSMKGTG